MFELQDDVPSTGVSNLRAEIVSIMSSAVENANFGPHLAQQTIGTVARLVSPQQLTSAQTQRTGTVDPKRLACLPVVLI